MPVGEALRDAYICDRDLRLCCCGEPANAEATTSRGDNVAQSSSRGSGKCGYTIRLPDTLEAGCGRFSAAAHRRAGRMCGGRRRRARNNPAAQQGTCCRHAGRDAPLQSCRGDCAMGARGRGPARARPRQLSQEPRQLRVL